MHDGIRSIGSFLPHTTVKDNQENSVPT